MKRLDAILRRVGLVRRSQVPKVTVSRSVADGTHVDIRFVGGLRIAGKLEGVQRVTHSPNPIY